MRILASNIRFGLLVAFVSALAGWQLHGVFPPADTKALDTSSLITIAATLAAIGATMMGFLLAALAVLASIAGTRLLRNMQRTGHYHVLLSRLLLSALFFLLLMLASVAAMLLVRSYPPIWTIIISLLLASVVTLIDASQKFAMVLFSLKPSGPATLE